MINNKGMNRLKELSKVYIINFVVNTDLLAITHHYIIHIADYTDTN